MKIPIDHVTLDELGYQGYWVDMPKSVKEGWLYEFQQRTAPAEGDGEEERKLTRAEQADANRDAYGGLLELVTGWNLDDEEGTVLPLLKTLRVSPNGRSKAKAEEDVLGERNRVLSELPIDVILFLSDRLTSSLKPGDKTEDFSNKS